ncbi:MAG: transposase [Nostoc sp.]|uniref:transposase n=1 Tax=Nostoc sp. TaxID=1180 RepID=UPI002FF7447F
MFPKPKHYKTNLEKLRRLSRKFAKKVNGSAHKQKAKLHLAKHHARVTNLRKDLFIKLLLTYAKITLE